MLPVKFKNWLNVNNNASIIRGRNLIMSRICIFTFNIITTNKNNTAIAPTYIIINSKPKKSAPKIKQIAAAFRKVRTKKRIEWTEFSDRNTNRCILIYLTMQRPKKISISIKKTTKENSARQEIFTRWPWTQSAIKKKATST